MPAFRLTAWQQPPELVEVPVPDPGPGEVLVRVAGNGLCHSDITMMDMPGEIGEALGWHMPFTLGHEAAGWVERLGAGVDPALRLSVGDAVALVSANACRRCRWCRSGRDSLCEANLAGRGYGRDGGLAGFVVARADELVPLGSLDPTTAGTLTDAGATSYHAVSRVMAGLAGVDRPTVVVIGVGGLGAFAVQILRAAGEVTVVAVDPDPGRRARAIELGADHALDGVDRGTRRALRDLVPDGADGVIDVVGSDATIDCGVRSLARGGVFALVGAAGGKLDRPWFSTLPHEAEIFTFQGSSIAHVRAMVELARAGHVVIDARTYPLDRVEEAYRGLRDGTLDARAVVVPQVPQVAV